MLILDKNSWLVKQEVYDRLLKVSQTPGALSDVKPLAARSRDGILSVVGNQASIPVEGILTRHYDFWLEWAYGANTSYLDIQAAFLKAENDPTIEVINFDINSPGGHVDGLFETLDMIAAGAKPTRANITGMAASAAFAIMSQTDRAEASNRADEVGSVGVAVSYFVSENIVDIASTKAPKKRPDVTTDEGKAMVREELDAIHDLFVDSISKGRSNATGENITAKKINADFGQGAIVLAGDAVKRGMIDGISSAVPDISTALNVGGDEAEEAFNMDINQLKTQHPAVYQAAVQVGVDQGTQTERDRCTAHLTYAKSTGAMNIAVEAIESGDIVTETLRAKYLTAGINKQTISTRDDDEESLNGANSNLEVVDTEAASTQVVELVEKGLGIEGVK